MEERKRWRERKEKWERGESGREKRNVRVIKRDERERQRRKERKKREMAEKEEKLRKRNRYILTGMQRLLIHLTLAYWHLDKLFFYNPLTHQHINNKKLIPS